MLLLIRVLLASSTGKISNLGLQRALEKRITMLGPICSFWWLLWFYFYTCLFNRGIGFQVFFNKKSLSAINFEPEDVICNTMIYLDTSCLKNLYSKRNFYFPRAFAFCRQYHFSFLYSKDEPQYQLFLHMLSKHWLLIKKPRLIQQKLVQRVCNYTEFRVFLLNKNDTCNFVVGLLESNTQKFRNSVIFLLALIWTRFL